MGSVSGKIKEIWSFNLQKKLYKGFTNFELEKLCENDENGSVPWLFWTTEIYSFGRCYREWLEWPKSLPIPVYGDHGVSLNGKLAPHERNNKAKYHLTFNKKRYESIKGVSSKEILRVLHPWVQYRRRYDIKKNNDAKGTLVFYSHSNNGIEIINKSNEKYIEKLKNLPEDFKPLVICMHMHDINDGTHKELQKLGIPIVSAGNTSSIYFVDRFYDLVKNFKYATSDSGGSELFYCVELGVPYFLYGNKPTYFNTSHKEAPLGIRKFTNSTQKELTEKKEELFRIFPPNITKEQISFVNDSLGIDSTIKARKLKKIFIKEMIRFSPVYFSKLFLRYCKAVMKNGYKIVTQKIYRKY